MLFRGNITNQKNIINIDWLYLRLTSKKSNFYFETQSNNSQSKPLKALSWLCVELLLTISDNSTHSHSSQLNTATSWTNGYPPVTSMIYRKENTSRKDTGKLPADRVAPRSFFAKTKKASILSYGGFLFFVTFFQKNRIYLYKKTYEIKRCKTSKNSKP